MATFGESLKSDIRDSNTTGILMASQYIANDIMRWHSGNWEDSLRAAVGAIFDFLLEPEKDAIVDT